MATTSERLQFILTLDSRGAITGLQKFGNEAERGIARVDDRMDRLGGRMQAFGVGAVASSAIAGRALFGLAKASEEAERSSLLLQNAIKNSPKIADDAAEEFEDLAAAIQDKTAADGDQIVEAQAVLVRMKLEADQVKELTPLVVDLARAKGIDLVQASTLAAKAADGNAGALKRAGIAVDEAIFATDSYTGTVEALRSAVGGFAEEEGKTFAGSVERMKNELGDLAEGVGVGVVDAFTDMFGLVDGLVDKFNGLSPGVQSAAGQMVAWGTALFGAAGAASFVIGSLLKMRANFGLAASSIRSTLPLLGRIGGTAGGILAVGSAVGFLAESLQEDLDADVGRLENALLGLVESGELGGEAARVFGDDLGTLKTAIEEITDAGLNEELAHVSDSLGNALSFGKLDTDLEQARERIDALDKALAQLASRDPEAARQALVSIAGALAEQGVAVDELVPLLDDYDGVLTEIDTASRTAEGGIAGLNEETGEGAEVFATATEAVQDYLDTLRAGLDPLFAMADATADNQQAMADAEQAARDLDAAVAEYGAGSIEAMIAAGELDAANRRVAESALGVTSAAAQLAAAVEDGTVSVDVARQTLAEWVAQGLITEGQAANVAAQFDTVAGKANELQGQRVNMSVTADTSQATGALDSLLAKVSRIQTFGLGNILSKTVTQRQRDADFARFLALSPADQAYISGFRAEGGTVAKGEPYVVGEKGPELFVPNESGTIVPADKRDRYMRAMERLPGMAQGGFAQKDDPVVVGEKGAELFVPRSVAGPAGAGGAGGAGGAAGAAGAASLPGLVNVSAQAGAPGLPGTAGFAVAESGTPGVAGQSGAAGEGGQGGAAGQPGRPGVAGLPGTASSRVERSTATFRSERTEQGLLRIVGAPGAGGTAGAPGAPGIAGRVALSVPYNPPAVADVAERAGIPFRTGGTGSVPYTVGSAGPELFISNQSGTIIPADRQTAAAITIAGRANGGKVTARTPYLVGEYQPELFVPDKATPAAPNGTGPPPNGDTINVYYPQAEPTSETLRRLEAIKYRAGR